VIRDENSYRERAKLGVKYLGIIILLDTQMIRFLGATESVFSLEGSGKIINILGFGQLGDF